MRNVSQVASSSSPAAERRTGSRRSSGGRSELGEPSRTGGGLVDLDCVRARNCMKLQYNSMPRVPVGAATKQVPSALLYKMDAQLEPIGQALPEAEGARDGLSRSLTATRL